MAAPAIVKAPVTRRTNTTLNPTSHRRGPNASTEPNQARASQFMVLGGKVRALLKGRYTVSTEDIQALAKPVLRHRILTNFHAESEGITEPDHGR